MCEGSTKIQLESVETGKERMPPKPANSAIKD